MHKAVILLTKAESREDAESKVTEFLSPYGDGDVWDWYQIGGRWSGTLAPIYKGYEEKAMEILKQHPDNKDRKWISQKSVDESIEKLRELWVGLGMTGTCPYDNHYNLPEGGADYDIVLLKDCLCTVKEWSQNPIDEGKKLENKAKDWINGVCNRDRETGKALEPMWSMYGFCLKRAGSLFSQDFCFDCNVFNVDEYDYSVPDDVIGWYAVMVDMHN